MNSPKTDPPEAKSQRRHSRWKGVRGFWWNRLACGVLFLRGLGGLGTLGGGPSSPHGDASPPPVREAELPPGVARLPRIAPDYLEVVIPPNLAPLNLTIQEPGIEFQLRVSGAHGQALEIRQAHPQVRFPLREWKGLLEANRGTTLRWNLAVRHPAGEWTSYAPFDTPVAADEIDPYLIYRRLQPLYSTYKRLGVYQRHLETFEETPVLRNETIGGGCVNCHTPQPGVAGRFAISFRGRFGTPTLLVDSTRVSRVDVKLGYLSWHPSGKLLAFAANEITQFFHVAGPANRDVYDARSDLGILHVESRTVEKPDVIATPDHSENWPCWAPDGRYLYYCSGPAVAFENASHFRYDLRRIPYDPDRNQWGKPETLIPGAEHRLSAHQPRVSPDGRLVVFTATETGSFPLFRSDSDLFLLRLDTRRFERLPINSHHAETWHCWSSNGRWLLFNSRGLDGVFARLMISHVDPAARFSKPLLLPQEDPAYYETCLHNFNAPELACGPVQISEEELARAVTTPGNLTGPAGQASPPAEQAPDGSMAAENPHQ